jgi:hypothetical protein
MNQNDCMNVVKTGIHCKVSYNGQFRRFLFNGTEFTSLKTQVEQLLDLKGEFVLKYKDNESDLITISSDEELVCALSFSDGVLRIVVDQGMDVTPMEPMYTPGSCPTEFRDCRGGRWKHERGFRCRGRRGGEHKKVKLALRRDWIKSQLESFPKDTPLSPEQLKSQKMLEMKLNHVNFFLERLEHPEKFDKQEWKKRREEWRKRKQEENDNCPGEWKKCGDWKEKRWNHHHWKNDNKNECKKNKEEKKELKKALKAKCDENLSPSEKEEITLLKVQIDSIKPEICELKKQIKAVKLSVKEGHGDPSTQWKEVYGLKMKLLELRNRVYPLKLRIREIRKSSVVCG